MLKEMFDTEKVCILDFLFEKTPYSYSSDWIAEHTGLSKEIVEKKLAELIEYKFVRKIKGEYAFDLYSEPGISLRLCVSSALLSLFKERIDK